MPGALSRRWRAVLRRRRSASKSEGAARIEVVIPAVQAGLQRGTLVMQSSESSLPAVAGFNRNKRDYRLDARLKRDRKDFGGYNARGNASVVHSTQHSIADPHCA